MEDSGSTFALGSNVPVAVAVDTTVTAIGAVVEEPFNFSVGVVEGFSLCLGVTTLVIVRDAAGLAVPTEDSVAVQVPVPAVVLDEL